MANIGKILEGLSGLSKIVPGILKDHKGNLSSKRFVKLAGGGGLITLGSALIMEATEIQSPQFLGGCFMVVIGAALAALMKTKDAEIEKDEKE